MTELQKFIIRNIPTMFSSKEQLDAISKEYEEIFKTKLKDDYSDYANKMIKIWKGI